MEIAFDFPWVKNPELIAWIQEQIDHCQPDRVFLCEGSSAEYDAIAQEMVARKTLVPLKKRPNSYWCHSHPDDVARIEECTFICSKLESDAGPTNRWAEPHGMKKKLTELFFGCMRGRTMYVVPYCMGPITSSMSRIGVEITDSPYVVLNMHWMTRMGLQALREGPFCKGIHSVGVPLKAGVKDIPWPCNPAERVIAHFPHEKSIYSFGSGYGGNALLSKKCFALRIASFLGKEEGWLAEHMLILGLTNSRGEKKHIAAAFPSACGKTNLAMMTPTIPGWKVECVGDDIAWMHIGKDGYLRAINPEAGFFGVAPGTSFKTNPNAMISVERDTIFTNVALTPDGDVWWEGIGTEPPAGMISWLGKPWDPKSGELAAHPNSRFTVSIRRCPIYDSSAEESEGVPISAILFGGRRNSVMPLVIEAYSWAHGVLLGATLSSETTAAAKGELGKLRHDPFAMLPFCGYHMGDYFAHWLQIGQKIELDKRPKFYGVNWFRKDKEGKFLWPGFGDNIRVLKWIFDRVYDHHLSYRGEIKEQRRHDKREVASVRETPIGLLPEKGSLDLSGIEVDEEGLLCWDVKVWQEEAAEMRRYFEKFGDKLPVGLSQELDKLGERLETYSLA